MNFFIEMFLQVFYLPSTTVIKTRDLEGAFLRSFLKVLHLQLLVTTNQFLLKSFVGNETWLTKLTEVSNYRKFICNNFVWDIVQIWIIRAKVDMK